MLRQSISLMNASTRGSSVITRQMGRCHSITLNRPSALNALNVEMIESLLDYYNGVLHSDKTSNAGVACVLLRGAGGKAFCAGGDVVSLVKDPQGIGAQFFYREYQLDHLIATLRHPHVAIWDGFVMGGGVGISVHGSHRIATETTNFAMPETAIGLFPDVGGSWFLPRLPYEGLGLYLALTGHRLKGMDVFHAGIATHFIPKDQLEKFAGDVVSITSSSEVDGVIRQHATTAANAPAEFSLKPFLPQIASIFGKSSNSVEEIFAKLSKDESEWAQKQLKTLKNFSPMSLKLSFEAQRRSLLKCNTIEDVFRMEFNVANKCLYGHDFKAGVTRLLIEKQKGSPEWSPKSVEEVAEGAVDTYFRPMDGMPVWQPTGNPFASAQIFSGNSKV